MLLNVESELIGTTASVVDLLSAASQELGEGQAYDSDSEDSDSDLSPTSPNHDHAYDSSASSATKINSVRPGPPKRGQSYYSNAESESRVHDELDMLESGIEQNQISAGPTPEPAASIDPVARLKILVDEYGPWCDDSEEFVASTPAALYRGVLIKGLCSLTNRRLFFFAYVPQQAPGALVMKGAITIHYPGILTPKRKVWAELYSDTFSYFTSSRRLTKPIASCRLSQVKTVHPWNENDQYCFKLDLLDGRTRRLEFSTQESCIAWRNALEATVFTFKSTSDRLRLSLPLELITDVKITPYFALAERCSVTFFSNPDDPTLATSSVELGYLKSHHSFAESLEVKLVEAKANPALCRVQPILEVFESTSTQGDSELQGQLSEDEGGLAAKFIRNFGLADDELPALFISPSCELIRTLPAWGALAISKDYILFWRRSLVGADIKLRIPLVDVDDVRISKAFGFRISGLSIQIHGGSDIRLDFRSQAARDEVISQLQTKILEHQAAALQVSPAKLHLHVPHRDGSWVLGQDIEEIVENPDGIVSSRGIPSILNTRSEKMVVSPKKIVCLTIGSRGDVQPYISLGLELMKDGHTITIASHPEYREWVESFGIAFKDVGGDPGALMELNIKHKMFSPGFFKESLGHFRHWLDVLLDECAAAVQGADILIESPVTMAGIHVAEAYNIPYFRCFTMPWTPTTAYPHSFAAGGTDLGAVLNELSYNLFDTIMWKATQPQINRWRKKTLGLRSTTLAKLSPEKTPFIYNFSSFVVPRPIDYPDWITVAGYFFLETRPTPSADGSIPDWAAPSLHAFIQKAKDDGKPIVYIGFGSIVVQDAAALTAAIASAVVSSGVRAILSKGWSDRRTHGSTSSEQAELPEEIYQVASVPHDKLFPLIDAVVHHGGSGSTGASLRAGLPTVIHPFFGDQFHWANTVEKSGVGLRIDSLTAKVLSKALVEVTGDRIMKEKAEILGAKIRTENGPRVAVDFIYGHLRLAKEQTELRIARAAKVRTPLKLDLTRSFSLRANSPSRAGVTPLTPNSATTGSEHLVKGSRFCSSPK